MNKRKFLVIWSVAVGSMDAVTGLMLAAAPALVLQGMRVALPSADALVFVRWIGVFVAGVGLSYAMALGERHRGKAVWLVTSMLRTLVAVFVLTQIDVGALAPTWLVVALTDAVVAVGQMFMLRAGWWDEARR